MNWGKGIIIGFVLFGAFIVSLVAICMRQDISLVSPNYYQEELHFQQQLDRLVNATHLAEKPQLDIRNNTLRLRYSALPNVTAGEIRLTRPSDARMDQVFTLAPSTGTITEFALPQLPGGRYLVSMQWTAGGKEYRIEDAIIL